MTNLCADIGYKSINHYGEQLCGDHVDVVKSDDSVVAVLADGLGSGVKASILSTLTAKIISTMLAQGLPITECVNTVAATLPVCSVRGVAYSTFTVLNVRNDGRAEIIEYDNPKVIMFRHGKYYDYPREELNVSGKKIYRADITLEENDEFFLMSDGCPHAGIGLTYNFGWKRDDIIAYLEPISDIGYTAKTLATVLVDECDRLYENKPGDDATACVVKMRKRTPLNFLFGPPFNREDGPEMLKAFFDSEGKHVVAGGTTSTIAAEYLKKPLKTSFDFVAKDIPPIGYIDGVDLVTEGVITVSKVVEYAKDYLNENKFYPVWSMRRDGASLMARALFEDATDVKFFVGRAINPAHQNPDLPINFNIKMNLVKDLAECLRKMGKEVEVTYY